MLLFPFLLSSSAWALIRIASTEWGVVNVTPVFNDFWRVPSIRSLGGRAVQAWAGYRPNEFHGWLLGEASEEEIRKEQRSFKPKMGLLMFRLLRMHEEPWFIPHEHTLLFGKANWGKDGNNWLLKNIDWSQPSWNEEVRFERCPPELWHPLAEHIFQQLPAWRAIELINQEGMMEKVHEADRLEYERQDFLCAKFNRLRVAEEKLNSEEDSEDYSDHLLDSSPVAINGMPRQPENVEKVEERPVVEDLSHVLIDMMLHQRKEIVENESIHGSETNDGDEIDGERKLPRDDSNDGRVQALSLTSMMLVRIPKNQQSAQAVRILSFLLG